MPVPLCIDGEFGEVVQPGTAGPEGCAPLAASNTFTVAQNQCSTLEWVIRNPQGEPYDLSACALTSVSGSVSDSVSGSEDSGYPFNVVVRVDRAMKVSTNPPPIELTGVVHDPANGVVHVQLPPSAATASGIYQAHFALVSNSNGSPIVINRTLLSIEPSLFSPDYGVHGPPTINEIRVYVRDASPELNRLLLTEEYTEREVLEAIVAPVREWNETPPHLPVYVWDTQTFPFKQMWLVGIQGYLARIVSHHYRRNQFNYQAAGVSIKDLDKEQQYLQASNLFMAEWKDWLLKKKAEVNRGQLIGGMGSGYLYSGPW